MHGRGVAATTGSERPGLQPGEEGRQTHVCVGVKSNQSVWFTPAIFRLITTCLAWSCGSVVLDDSLTPRGGRPPAQNR